MPTAQRVEEVMPLPQWVAEVKIFVSHVNAHQKVTSAEDDFNIQVGKMTHSVDSGQPFSSVTSS